MESALIVSSTEKGKDNLAALLRGQSFNPVSFASNCAEARRALISSSFTLVVINSPLTDEFGHELAMYINENTSSGVIMIVKSEMADGVSEKVEEYGVFVVPKPLSKTFFYQAVRLVMASRRRMLGVTNENIKLKRRIEEMKLVDRAKCALIQYLNMTEPQAHRYIEKQAMDMRVSKCEIAQGIIKNYES